MLERYTLTKKAEEISRFFKVDVTHGYQPFYNGAPTHLLPVITHLHPKGFSFFYWGLPPQMTKNKPVSKKFINADREELGSKTTYLKALLNRRCVIPADGFYLWKKVSKKGRVPYRFILNDEKPFFIAGIWEEFDLLETADTHTFSMITIPSQLSVRSFSEVIPAIVDEKYIQEWFDPDTSEKRLMDIINKTLHPEFGSFPVSSNINNINLNTPDLIKATKPVDQFGNYSLFD